MMWLAAAIAAAIAFGCFWLSVNVRERSAWLPRAVMIAAGLAALACVAVAIAG